MRLPRTGDLASEAIHLRSALQIEQRPPRRLRRLNSLCFFSLAADPPPGTREVADGTADELITHRPCRAREDYGEEKSRQLLSPDATGPRQHRTKAVARRRNIEGMAMTTRFGRLHRAPSAGRGNLGT